MNPIKYHFPDPATLKNSIENNRAMIHQWFDKDNPYLCQIEELAAIHLSDKDKTEDEVDILVRSFFSMPAVQGNQQTISLTNLIKLQAIDDDLVNRIKKTLLECARFPRGDSQVPNSVAGIRLSNQCDPSMSDLYIAADCGFTQEAKEIIDLQPESISSKTSLGTSPLHIACLKGHLEIVYLLLDAGASIQDCDNKNLTALDFAIKARLICDNTHFQIVKALLQKGKDLGLKIEQISNSHLLYEACLIPRDSMISLLFEYGVEVEKQGYDSLKSVVKLGLNDIVKLLLANRIAVDPPLNRQQSALFVATFCNHFDVFLTLLEAGANVNLRDVDGAAPLHVAALKGNMRFVELLIEKGADINLRDDLGYTPIQYASSGKHQAIVAKLYNLGARV